MSATNKLEVLSPSEKIFGQTLSISKDSAKFLAWYANKKEKF